MALSPDEEIEALELELELRKRSTEIASGKPATPKAPNPADQWKTATPQQRLAAIVRKPDTGGVVFDNPYSPGMEPGVEVGSTFKEAGKFVGRAALSGGPPAIGQAIGVATGPFAPVAVPILGAIGGVVGDVLEQTTEEGPFRFGRMAGAALEGAIPGAPLAKAGTKELAKEAAKYAVTNIGSKVIETEIDEGRAPTAGEYAFAAGSAPITAGIAKGVAKLSPVSEEEAINRTRKEIFSDLRKEGVAVDPKDLSPAASLTKQAIVWQKLTREEMGLGKTAAPISMDELKAFRAQNYAPYEELQTMSEEAKRDIKTRLDEIAKEPDYHVAHQKLDDPAMRNSMAILEKLAAADVDELKQARNNAKRAYDIAKRTGNPEQYEKWHSETERALKIEDAIEEAAATVKDPSLLKRLRDARKEIAKSYSIEQALNPSTGLVDVREFGRQIAEGRPVSGNLRRMGDFANSFDTAAIGGGRLSRGQGVDISLTAPVASAKRGMISTLGKTFLLSDFLQDHLAAPTRDKKEFAERLARYLSQNAQEQAARDESRQP